MFEFLTAPFFLGLGVGTVLGVLFHVQIAKHYAKAKEKVEELKD